MSANLPSVFNIQFFAPAVNGVAMVAAGYQIQAYLNGTTTPHNTFTSSSGGTPNANPLTLDDDGRATMFFDPAVVYTLVLIDTLGAPVETFNDVSAAASTTNTVTSVNSLTGAVALDASNIPYTTSSGATWLTADDVEGALDQIADQANAPPASSVTVSAIAGLTATNAQDALAELSGKATGNRLLRITPILTTATWTKGDDVGSILVKLAGGGGGSNASLLSSGGGGGGGGAEKFIDTPVDTLVTIGAGGVVGGTGGTTSFGSIVSATGGTAGGTTIGGLGGNGVSGDRNIRGQGGGWGADAINNYFGPGGGSFLGGGARGNVGGGSGSGASQAGDANTGGGGSGGTSGGAAGGSGACYVYEYSV